MVPVKHRLGESALQEEDVDGLRRSCRLLRSLAGEDALELLQEFAPWVLRAAPEEGLKLFTLGEASTVPIAPFVLELLQGLAEPQRSEFRARYVQYLVVMHRGMLFDWRIDEQSFDPVTRGCRMAQALLDGWKQPE